MHRHLYRTLAHPQLGSQCGVADPIGLRTDRRLKFFEQPGLPGPLVILLQSAARFIQQIQGPSPVKGPLRLYPIHSRSLDLPFHRGSIDIHHHLTAAALLRHPPVIVVVQKAFQDHADE